LNVAVPSAIGRDVRSQRSAVSKMHHPHISVWKAVRGEPLLITGALGETHRFMRKK
jgi:hypothetical protein